MSVRDWAKKKEPAHPPGRLHMCCACSCSQRHEDASLVLQPFSTDPGREVGLSPPPPHTQMHPGTVAPLAPAIVTVLILAYRQIKANGIFQLTLKLSEMRYNSQISPNKLRAGNNLASYNYSFSYYNANNSVSIIIVQYIQNTKVLLQTKLSQKKKKRVLKFQSTASNAGRAYKLAFYY